MRFNGGKQMNIKMLKGKIHRATVVQAELEYIGSITVDTVSYTHLLMNLQETLIVRILMSY